MDKDIKMDVENMNSEGQLYIRSSQVYGDGQADCTATQRTD